MTNADTITVTANELSVLRSLLTNDFTEHNGAIPAEYGNASDWWVWSNCVDCGRERPLVSGSSLSGVTGSLGNKGLVEADGQKGRDACIRLTAAGFAVAVANVAV
jgi:hypothetical protein